MDSNPRVDDHYNFPKILNKETEKKLIRKVSFGDADNLNIFNKKENENVNQPVEIADVKIIGRNSTEEFWDDVKEEKNNIQQNSKVNNLQSANTQEFSSNNNSRKINYDNSLFKVVDFDDLITGGKVYKNKNELDDLNNGGYLITSPGFKQNINGPKNSDGKYKNLNSNIDSKHIANMTQPDFYNNETRIKMILENNKRKYSLINKKYEKQRNHSQDENINENKIGVPSISKSKSPTPQKNTKHSVPIYSRENKRGKTENNSQNVSKSKTKPLERVNLLHLKGKIKEEKIKRKQEENREMNDAKELENCTFTPQINTNYAPAKKSLINARQELSIYERQLLWNNQKLEKVEKEQKITKLQENIQCTFNPQISKNIVDFNNSKRIEDKSTKKYFERINNAKKNKEEINIKLNPDYNGKFERTMKVKTQKKESSEVVNKLDVIISEKEEDYATFKPIENTKFDFETARKNLHSQLLSMNFIDQN